VLEHVEQPEAFIAEAVRVAAPGGRIVLSSPNFFRVIGFRDYHPSMRGWANKCRNARRLLAKYWSIRRAPDSVRFDRMTPIVKQPFTPDDDAIVATNALEMAFFLERSGARVERVECTDRYVPKILDVLLNLLPTKWGMLNAFVVATKRHDPIPDRGQSPVG
jgi:SAM-dependent methyltransferase